MTDLFAPAASAPSGNDYSAKDIRVLEGLEPVRQRPGMYIGGTDDRALHHLAAEVLDNSMDEAVAGHATRIEVSLDAEGCLTVDDNGRGIPVDPHPKFPDKSALEVILTTLHSGGKFEQGAYQTAGGLHGVGVSVVNALSDDMVVEVARDRQLYRQSFSRGFPQGPLETLGPVQNRRGTRIRFHPDPQIFGDKLVLKASRLYRMARSKAYLFPGVEIRWRIDPALATDDTPAEAVLHFPGGLADFLVATLGEQTLVAPEAFAGRVELPDNRGRVEWALQWLEYGDGWTSSYCNTIPTPMGGSHENGFRSAISRGLKAYGELTGNKRAAQVTADDALAGTTALLSVFIPDPQFQGQTKEKLATPEAARLVEATVKDHFDHFLSAAPKVAERLLENAIDRAEERLRRRKEKEVGRKTATRKLRLPGKLADCSAREREDTELFIVEGDSAGGSAKSARKRETQAVLPLRGKILNVMSAGADKLAQNQELADLSLALGCGTGSRFNEDDLRYGKVIIMTDADVDGAHIAALLMTFFFQEMPGLVDLGRLYLACPPLYRLSQGGKTVYAIDDAHREQLMADEFSGRGKVEVSRFKGLGEMPPQQLRDTTMNPAKRKLLRVDIPAEARADTINLVERLMGRKPEKRMEFIQQNARFVQDVDI
ncbi:MULTISPECIES: DNA topoisomerase IV subunit B [unclassified Minwuia]|uniref:DNA topoisomerase IV subunit B n=1 Tax=unclassified Minwuia TaxID=2618799 RepID=UPI002479E2A8|nr:MULTISPECIES: DNA topoisomerase IV subunit B [unclassified Minwuia]